MKKKSNLFIARLVTFPGAFFSALWYEFEMYRKPRTAPDVTVLKNNLVDLIPWSSVLFWVLIALILFKNGCSFSTFQTI